MTGDRFERLLVVHRGPVIEGDDLLIVDPASAPAPRWSGSRRDIAGFLAACDLPLLQLRGGARAA